jgi:hypothetical protein
MAKLSYGDLSNNSLVPNNDSSASVEEMLKKIENSFPTEETVKSNPNIKNAITINKNQDGSLKYTFDNIYEDKELAEIAKDYYTNRDEQVYDNKTAVDKFISDRTWNQANTVTMAKEFTYITGENAGEDQKSRLNYLTKYWDNLPNFYEEGGRGAKGFFANLGVGVLDPINIIGAGVGGQVAKGVLKKGAQEVVKSQIKKGIAKKTVAKEILNSPTEFAKLATKTKREALIKGSASMALVDGAGFGTIDIANQTVEKEIGLRETLDPVRTGTVALTAAGLGFFVGVGGGYVGNAIRNLRLAKNTELPTKNLKKAAKDAPDNTGKSEGLNNDLKTGSYIRTNLVDQWDFVKVLQKEITGVEGSVASLKKIYKSGKYKSDPILEPYFQLRTLAASSTRAHNFIMSGVLMPPKAGTRSASYTKGQSKGLHEILKTFDDNNEANDFLQYVSAKRQVALAKRGSKVDKSLPMDKNVRKEFIDFAEMTPLQYAKKYKTTLTRKSEFTKGLADYKKFTDDLMEYQVRSGLLSEAEAKVILKENPYFIPLTRDKLADTGTGVISAIKKQTQKVFGLSRPGSVKLATTKQTGDINLYQNLVTYANKTVMSGDRNRAKLAFYEMLQKGDKLGKFKVDDIASRVKANDKRLVRFQNVASETVTKAYEKAGAKLTIKKEPDRLDILTFSNTFRESKDAPIIDIVYRNGKQEMYEIKNPNLAEIFKGLGESGANRVFNMFSETGIFSRYARLAAQAITYSPPFVAFNVIRDTLAGTINSAFGIGSRALPGKVGYVPGFTTVKGYIGALRQTQTFKEAMINGMGYSSRAETEALQPKNLSKMIEQGSRLNVDTRLTNYYTGYLSKFKNVATAGGRQYKKLVQSAEYATRLGEYELAKAAGFSDIGAAFAGREVATDFGMHGSNAFLNAVNRNTMFLNASLQGLYRTGRTFGEQPARAAALVTTTIVAPSIALYHLNSKHPEYSLVPNQVKQLNYLIPNYTIDENGKRILDKDLPFYLVPKPYDLGIFANVAEGIIDGLYKKSDGVTKQYVAESFSQITPGLPIPTGFRPFLEMMINKNLYSGAPVIGIYELQRLDELQARGTTRQIAKSISTLTGNLSSMLMRKKEGTVDTPIFTPIEVDYILGAYLTGMLQYPVDILNAVGSKVGILPKDKPLEGERIAKREDESDFSSFKNAFSVVTRRFKVAAPIKNSQYHKEWRELIAKAKKLKQIDVTQMDFKKVHSSRLIGLFGRVQDKLEEGKQFGLEEEVIAFSKISDQLKIVQQQLIESQTERNNIINGPFTAEKKRELTDILINFENKLLKVNIDILASMEIEYIFDKTFGLKSLVLGTAENAVKPNPRENKN